MNDARSTGYPLAVWLLPAKHDSQWLKARITALAGRYSSPVFGPHVTLHVGQVRSHDTALAELAWLASQQTPLQLSAGPTEHSQARFQALFVSLPSEPLRPLADTVASIVSNADYEFKAHLSLLYATLEVTERAALAQANDCRGRAIRFDRLAAVAPDPDASDFSDVDGWRILGQWPLRRALTGDSSG